MTHLIEIVSALILLAALLRLVVNAPAPRRPRYVTGPVVDVPMPYAPGGDE